MGNSPVSGSLIYGRSFATGEEFCVPVDYDAGGEWSAGFKAGCAPLLAGAGARRRASREKKTIAARNMPFPDTTKRDRGQKLMIDTKPFSKRWRPAETCWLKRRPAREKRPPACIPPWLTGWPPDDRWCF